MGAPVHGCMILCAWVELDWFILTHLVGMFGWFRTRWSHLLCLTFMGKVVLADGGFGGFTSMSLLNFWVFGLMIRDYGFLVL